VRSLAIADVFVERKAPERQIAKNSAIVSAKEVAILFMIISHRWGLGWNKRSGKLNAPIVAQATVLGKGFDIIAQWETGKNDRRASKT
jgi:hypothetical protein